MRERANQARARRGEEEEQEEVDPGRTVATELNRAKGEPDAIEGNGDGDPPRDSRIVFR
jgi:hypothetical protein